MRACFFPKSRLALEKIMQRKSPDITLEADDVFYVPDNKTRRTTFTVIDRITAFALRNTAASFSTVEMSG